MVLILFSLLAFQPAFEVASVKATPPETRIVGDLVSNSGGRVLATRCNLELLLEEAFSAEKFQISGGPGWIHSDYFDIDARPPASSKSSKTLARRARINDEQKQMLLALLVERFQLKYHRETRQGPVYFLVRTNKKLKLEEAKNKDKDAWPWVGSPNDGAIRGDGIAGVSISMAGMASRLSAYLERPVLDRTGLEGTFDFKFEYVPDDPNPDVASSILFSVQELGLKLESGKGPVETIVIDHAEKPTGN
jgi:uncharacterized protein (TIGR03435 family)